jgi:hypothetical protein
MSPISAMGQSAAPGGKVIDATAPGYGLIDLYADGSFDERYVHYQ